MRTATLPISALDRVSDDDAVTRIVIGQRLRPMLDAAGGASNLPLSSRDQVYLAAAFSSGSLTPAWMGRTPRSLAASTVSGIRRSLVQGSRMDLAMASRWHLRLPLTNTATVLT